MQRLVITNVNRFLVMFCIKLLTIGMALPCLLFKGGDWPVFFDIDFAALWVGFVFLCPIPTKP